MKNIETIRLLFAANIISGLAQGITMVAIPWYFIKIVNAPEKFTTAYLVITFLTLFCMDSRFVDAAMLQLSKL